MGAEDGVIVFIEDNLGKEKGGEGSAFLLFEQVLLYFVFSKMFLATWTPLADAWDRE